MRISYHFSLRCDVIKFGYILLNALQKEKFIECVRASPLFPPETQFQTFATLPCIRAQKNVQTCAHGHIPPALLHEIDLVVGGAFQ